jgi:NAD(P)H dehydrogenase (quinone)
MILVTGATGKLGTAVVHQLLKKTSANGIAALVRDESKASDLKAKGVDIRLGSYDDTASLEQAMQGIEKVLLIAGTDEEKRVRQHQQVIDAAKKAGVGCVAYTSRTLKDRTTMANKLMEGHFQTEDYLKASGIGYAIFRNVLYMDALPQFVGEKVFESGIHSPVGQGKVPYALRSEMGEAIANWLVEGHCENKTYNLTGTEAYSFDDVASTLSTLSGKKVTYTPVEAAAFGEQMKGRGTPDLIIGRVIGFLTDIKNGQEEDISPELEKLLGRKPASLQQGLKVLFEL